jgi:rubrerythrin
VLQPPAYVPSEAQEQDDSVVLAEFPDAYDVPRGGSLRPIFRRPISKRQSARRPEPVRAAQAAPAARYPSEPPWSCSACTFKNRMTDERCAMCDTRYDSILQEAAMIPVPDFQDVSEHASGPVRMFQPEPKDSQVEQLARRVQELEVALQASNRRNEELTRALGAASQESIRQLQENHQCGICFLSYNTTNHRPRSSSCGHTYCGSCWDRHEAGSANISCPNCRAVIVRPTAPNIEIEAILHLGLKRKSRSRHSKKSLSRHNKKSRSRRVKKYAKK